MKMRDEIMKLRESQGLEFEELKQKQSGAVEKSIDKNEKFVAYIKNEFEQEVKNRKRERSDFTFEMNQLKEEVKNNLQEMQVFLNTFHKFSDILACMVEDTQMQHALTLQEEIDKRSISLYGVKNDEQ